jgi:hypothetical protein
MISWFFTMIELINGDLPWRRITDRDAILRMKESISPEELCAQIPAQFVAIYEGLLRLNYEDRPDYDMILTLLTEALRTSGTGPLAELYDWELLDEQTLSSISVRPLRRVSDVADAPKYDPSQEVVRGKPLLEHAPQNIELEVDIPVRRCCGKCVVS